MTKRATFFWRCSWFKFNNLRLALGIALKFNASGPKGLKLKVREFRGLIPTFVEVKKQKLVGGSFRTTSPILNSVKARSWEKFFKNFIYQYLLYKIQIFSFSRVTWITRCYIWIFKINQNLFYRVIILYSYKERSFSTFVITKFETILKIWVL